MSRGNWAQHAITVVLLLCSITVTGLLIRRELMAPHNTSSGRPHVVDDWQMYGSAGHREGPKNAIVSLVVFSDFQCPPCRIFAGRLKAIRQQYPTQIAVITRHLPLHSHPFALAAARASECAASQGRFGAYHDALFKEQEAIGSKPWEYFAKNAGIPDIASFNRCVSDLTTNVAAIARDTSDAKRLEISGTPSYLVNNLRYTGVPTLQVLRQEIVRAMGAERAKRDKADEAVVSQM